MGYIEKGRAKMLTKVILWLVVISFVATIFVQWGAQSTGMFGSGGGTVFTINGNSISSEELQINEAFYNYLQTRLIRQDNLEEMQLWNGAVVQIGGSLAGSIFEGVDTSQPTAQRYLSTVALMSGDMVLSRKARQAGIRATEKEVIRELSLTYRDRDGKFLGQSQVTQDLAVFNIGTDREPRFMELLKRNIEARHYVASLFASVQPELSDQVRDLYVAQNQMINLNTVTFNAIDYLDDVTYDNSTLRTYLQENTDSFAVTDMLRLDMALYANTLEITEEELSEYYEANKEDLYREDESRDIRRILIPLAPDADEEAVAAAQEQIAAAYADLERPGEEFETVVRRYSRDSAAQAGDNLITGITREGTADAALADAVFALQSEGQYTEAAVRTNAGLEIIQLVSINPGTVKPLSEVEDEIRDDLQEEKAEESGPVLMDQLRARAADTPWEELTDSLYITWLQDVIVIDGEDDVFIAGDSLNSVASPDNPDALLALEEGGLSDVVDLAEDLAFFRVKHAGESLVEQFEAIRPAVVRTYSKKESLKLANRAAESFEESLAGISTAEAFNAAAEAAGVEATATETNRLLGLSQYGTELLNKAVKQGAGSIIGPVELDRRYTVALVTNVAEVNEEVFEAQAAGIRNQLLQSWMQGQPNFYSFMGITDSDFSTLLNAQFSHLLANTTLSVNRGMIQAMFAPRTES